VSGSKRRYRALCFVFFAAGNSILPSRNAPLEGLDPVGVRELYVFLAAGAAACPPSP